MFIALFFERPIKVLPDSKLGQIVLIEQGKYLQMHSVNQELQRKKLTKLKYDHSKFFEPCSITTNCTMPAAYNVSLTTYVCR